MGSLKVFCVVDSEPKACHTSELDSQVGLDRGQQATSGCATPPLARLNCLRFNRWKSQ